MQVEQIHLRLFGKFSRAGDRKSLLSGTSSFGCLTLARMIQNLGYAEDLRTLEYDADFVIRGLVMDKQTGNIFKMDRHKHCGRAYHGRQPVPSEEVRRLYGQEKIHLSQPRFAWIDTLFALPEASLFTEIIERLEGRGQKVDYEKLHGDIRESIDTVHRDNSLKAEVKKDLARYLVKDLELAPALVSGHFSHLWIYLVAPVAGAAAATLACRCVREEGCCGHARTQREPG